MAVLSPEQAKSRERTLRASFLLSAWAPFVTGLAVIMSQSTTQIADFVRRTTELIALFISWQVFRYLARNQNLAAEARARLEKIAGLGVTVALVCSGVVMLILTASRLSNFEPGGNVYLGLGIAVLGLLTNTWFWRRYTRLGNEQYSPIMDTQRQLYQAKALVDLCVIAALGAIAVDPHHVVTRYIDLLGSVAVGIYLLWSGFNPVRQAHREAASPVRENGRSVPGR
jgi:divalent metal cation (Fe/Co/Zn/Cd) transporter